MAAEGLVSAEVTNSLYGGLSSTAQMVMVLVVLGMIGAVIGIIMWIMSHKHKVIIRFRTKDRKYIIEDKAREVTIQGVTYWKLLKMKARVSVPPPNALEITRKGRFMAECYWDADNPAPVWLEDKGTTDKSLQPFTTKERSFLVNEFRQAELRRKKGLLETLEKLAVPFALVMILVVMLVFFENIAKPAKEMMEANTQLSVDNAKISEQNARMLSVLAGKLDSGEMVIDQTIGNTPPVMQ